jgi:hypothetical protein
MGRPRCNGLPTGVLFRYLLNRSITQMNLNTLYRFRHEVSRCFT